MREIILHLGFHKTGSTSIQSSLYVNRNSNIIIKNGYLYPSSIPENHSIPFYSMFCTSPENYHIHIRNGFSSNKIKELHATWSKNFKEEILISRADKLIISGEDIAVLPAHMMEKFRDYILKITGAKKISVALYVRHPHSYIRSTYQQYISNGVNVDITKIKPLYKQKLINIFAVFGEKNCNIYRFEDAIAFNKGPVEHFCSEVLNISLNQINLLKIVKANVSPSNIACQICKFINEESPIFNSKKQINKPLRNSGDLQLILDIFKEGQKFELSHKEDLSISQLCNDIVGYINHFIDEPFALIASQEIKDKEMIPMPHIGQLFYLLKKYRHMNLYIRVKLLEYLHMVKKDKYSIYDQILKYVIKKLYLINVTLFIFDEKPYPINRLKNKLKVDIENIIVLNELLNLFHSMNYASLSKIMKLKRLNMSLGKNKDFQSIKKQVKKLKNYSNNIKINGQKQKGKSKTAIERFRNNLNISTEILDIEVFKELSLYIKNNGITEFSSQFMDMSLRLEK